MSASELFFSTNPTEPWSFTAVGWPAFAAVAALLVLLTLWTYRRNSQASGRRITLLLVLRLLALVVALLTAVRPSVGVQEDPKLPSTLLIGIDLSESMTVPDELNQPRIDAVRKVLDRCQPTFDELRDEQNVNVVLYGFGPAEFTDATHPYDPKQPAKYQRSDYGTYLNRTFDRWQSERFVRAHLVVGDGQHNGTAFRPEAEAARWRQLGRSVHTFAVGRTDIDPDSKDVAIKTVATPTANPDGSIFVKTEFVLKITVDALGFKGVKVPVIVSFDTEKEPVLTEVVTFTEDQDNEFELKLKAPEKPGEVRVKVEIPFDKTPGDTAPSNNVIETFIPFTKEGMRVLLVNRLNFDHAALRQALQSDKRIDLFQVIRQTDDPPTPQEREGLDFDRNGYDVIVLGNVSAKQLQAIDPQLPREIADQVLKKGVGLLMIGGHATFQGTPGIADATGWRGVTEITDILPVDLAAAPPVPDTIFTDPIHRFQFLPTEDRRDHYLTRLAEGTAESNALWQKLNDPANRSRFTGLSNMGRAKATATVFAVASSSRGLDPIPAKGDGRTQAPLLVGHEIGAGGRGRVLAFAAQDTSLWRRLGLPKSNDGIQIHATFWRHLVRWLAHQEEDDAAAFARPELKRLPVGGNQTIRVGLRAPGGVPATNPKFEVKVVAPGENPATAKKLVPIPDAEGGFKLPFVPPVAGEYIVALTATGVDKDNKEVKGEATARFLSYPEATDEMRRKSADHTLLRKIASAGGGKFHPLEELPAFLKELKSQPLESVKPKPRYLPDWRRDHSKGFLPAWLVLFVSLLGVEWGLRRLWGMV